MMSKQGTRETVKQEDQSYGAIVKRQFRKNKSAVWSLRFLMVIVFFGVMADFIANEKPLYCVYNGNTYFPVFKEYAVDLGLADWPKDLATITTWKTTRFESVVWPLIPYSPENLDFSNNDYVGPFDKQSVKSWRWKHWLGTDQLGRDVLAGMVHGSRVAMLVGIVSMSIASLIGILMGSLAGYFGDNRLKVTRISLILNLLFVVFAWFYAFSVRGYTLSDSFEMGLGGFLGQFFLSLLIFIGIMLIPNLIAYPLKKIPALGFKVTIPMDILISRFIEIFVSIPSLLLLLAIIAIQSKPSLYVVMVIIGMISWTGIARLIRGELLRVRSLEYIEAAQALGYGEVRVILRHAIPNALTSVLIAIAFGVASAILTESFLSFLGIGVPPEQVTWGSMLSAARSQFDAWWLAIFPGLAIFLTVTIFNLIGEGLTDALDPRLKR